MIWKDGNQARRTEDHQDEDDLGPNAIYDSVRRFDQLANVLAAILRNHSARLRKTLPVDR
jgi:hypothetical protein